MKLSDNALTVLKKRYLQEGETPEDRFRAIAKEVAKAEDENNDTWEDIYFSLMDNNLFIPNSPAIMNYGVPGRQRQGSACFVLEVKDDLSDIFDTMRKAALISKTGGGTGFNFSSLRPANSRVGSTGGVSSGPISFIKVYDAATESVKQGGVRKGANMGILEVWHPDIVDFIKCKADDKVINNFNLSVGVTEEFFKAVENDAPWELYWVNSHGEKEISKFIQARELFDMIVEYAHRNGEPGIIFVDRLQASNSVPSIPIVATNPCGEQPLPPWNSCVLGSINLANVMLEDWSDIDYAKLGVVVGQGTRFLDNIVTLNEYPLDIIKEKHDEQRRIGLGITGLADVLIMLGIPYGSKEGRKVAGNIMSFINTASHQASVNLGLERGSFPLFKQSTWSDRVSAMRNAATTTIAPTGR